MNLSKRSLIIISILFIIFVTGLAVVGFILQSKSTKETQSETGYVDPGSGEMIKSDKSPQVSADVLKNAIVYAGFSKLLDRGLSTTEIQSIQATIAEYSLSHGKKFKEVSLVVDSMQYVTSPQDPNVTMLTFSLKVNRTDDYYVTSTPKDSASSITRLYAADKKTLLIER